MRNRKRKMSMKKGTKKRISIGIRKDWDGDRVCERIHRGEFYEKHRKCLCLLHPCSYRKGDYCTFPDALCPTPIAR